MITRKICLFALCAALLLALLGGCGGDGMGTLPNLSKEGGQGEAAPLPPFTRRMREVDFAGLRYTPWDTAEPLAALGAQPVRDYTILIYMIGSDLESLEGSATLDIQEMLGSGVDTDRVNVILFTGGANFWQNDLIPAKTCALWRVEGDALTPLGEVGLLNMGDAGTLASFLEFGLKAFPARRSGLIFWDHAGGSIAGYGYDEHFDSSLSLLEMNYAFERAGLGENPLTFIGFDACLMASVEMAVVAAPYAQTLIASQDLEPGDGWDYSFLYDLGLNPQLNGGEIGRLIADRFIDYYGRHSREILTLSVIDLSRAGEVMGALDGLMSVCSRDLVRDTERSFTALAGRRGKTKSFGDGSPRDDACDMVDIRDMARKLSDLYPAETARLLGALEEAVVYNRHNSGQALGGLTSYYIFGGKETAARSLEIYRSLGMSGAYTAFLSSFAEILTGSESVGGQEPFALAEELSDPIDPAQVQLQLTLWQPLPDRSGYAMVGMTDAGGASFSPPPDALWPSVGGEFVALYEIERSGGKSLYAIPAKHNGREVNLIALISPEYPRGTILGARQREGFVIQKGYDDLNPGDVVSLYHRTRRFDGGDGQAPQWREGEEQTIGNRLTLDWLPLPKGGDYRTALLLTDLRQNERFTELADL